jgi:hypothetical protein
LKTVWIVSEAASLHMNSLTQWLSVNEDVLAVLVTVAVAVFLVCCLECTNCSKRDKDEIFPRHDL